MISPREMSNGHSSHAPCKDNLTVAAIAVAAASITTTAHEAIGHGSACLAMGGRITQLTSVYFNCTPGNLWIAIGGPAGNLSAAAIAWLALRLVPPRLLRLRLLLSLVMLLSLFWEAGYVIYAMVLNEGDWAIAARDAFGEPSWWWRIGGAALGLVLYRIGTRFIASSTRFAESLGVSPAWALRIAWLSASLGACLAALLYAPDRLEALHQAALEIGAASFPLLIVRPRMDASHPGPIDGYIGWVLFAAVLYAAFALTLGRGLP
ncbi:MAG: hypothetical protein WAW96_07980 [Alphaproteobacteria bacterium]